MSATEILLAQLADPFRIGLIVALLYTALRNRAVTGQVVPLLAGLVFVAVIIPATLQSGSPAPMLRLILIGLVANAILLAPMMAVAALIRRFRR